MIRVTDYGADKTGATDSSAAILAAISFAGRSKPAQSVEFPAGT